MPAFVKGAWYWFESPQQSWLPLKLLSSKEDKIVARNHLDEEFLIDESIFLPAVNLSSLVEIDNMVEMQELSEAAILHNLRLRFAKDEIYTYISSILVSVNPFKLLPIYSPTIMADYRTKLSAGVKTSPHVYALADAAFKQMAINGKNQSVIISGESGAGKTEATKLVLQYMAEMSGQSSEVEQQLLEANPVVEAFGNAKTVRNNNSSRFGKWIEITFNQKHHIAGAQIITYLLEQSRIVAPGQGERSYHIFYQLCQGLTTEQREAWKIGEADGFRVCNAGECLEVEGIDDSREFREMLAAMDVMKFTAQEKTDLLRTACAVMHIGNIDFNGTDKAGIDNMDVLIVAATLLGVDKETLSKAMVSQTKAMGREVVTTLLSKTTAEGNRDALCKAIYSNQFLWLVQRLNKSMYKVVESPQLVGVLDIFGFEIFEVNRFEQFCINFTNEKMQQHFNEHIFTMEQAEYRNDDIDVAHVAFIDNQECLDMIEKGRESILAMCDDELKVPKCTDDTLLTRLNTSFKNHKYYAVSKRKEPKFGVVHYAGSVDYTITGFLVKNLNKLSTDLAEVLTKSTYAYIRELAPDPSSVTVGNKFKTQLGELMGALQPTQPHFIRCIKSNNLKVSDTFDGPFVLRQLRYLGLKEVVNIRQLGYPIRRPHKEFCDRYRLLAPPSQAKATTATDYKQFAVSILEHTQCDPQHWRVGNGKVFVRNLIRENLEQRRETQLFSLARNLQALARAKTWRTRYLKLRIVEQEMKIAVEGEDPKLLDELISRYEVLQLNLNSRLLEACVRRRNFLIKKRAAERAMKAAIKAKDLSMLLSALEGAKEMSLLQTELGQHAQMLFDKITRLFHAQGIAVEKRDLNVAREAVELAKELEIDNAKEKQMILLVKALEAEAKVKDSLAKAMASRDLTQLRHALQVAINHKSGIMVDHALQRALDAGLESDPLVQEAILLEKTLDREVSVAKMAAELQAALDTNDLQILESTVKLAREPKMALGNHPLTLQCQEKIAFILKTKEVGALLLKAAASKNMSELDSAINEAKKNGLEHLGEYARAVQTRDDILESIRKVKEAQEIAERARIAAAEKVAAAREEEKRLGVIRAAEQRAEEEKLAKEEEAKEQARLDEVVNAALALGVSNDRDMQAAMQEQEKRKLVDSAHQLLLSAIDSSDMSLLANAISRAKDVGLPLEDANHKRARAVLKDLQAESLFREQELKEAEEATETNNILPSEIEEAPPPPAEDIPPRSDTPPPPPANDEDSSNKERKTTAIERTNTTTTFMNTGGQAAAKNSMALAAAARKRQEEEDQRVLAATAAAAAVKPFAPFIVSREEYSKPHYDLGLFTGLKSRADFVKAKKTDTDKATVQLGMLRYTKEPLPCALTKLSSPQAEQAALEVFKSIQGFMGDRHYSFADSLVCEILETLVDTPYLRNEAYIQVIKQLDQNPNNNSRVQAWMLLALLSEYVPPDSDCINYILHCTLDPDLVAGGGEDYAEYIQHTLKQTALVPVPAKQPGAPVCSVEKVTAFRTRSMKGSEVMVYLLDGSRVEVSLQPWVDTATILPSICKMFKCVDTEGLAIYELRDNSLNRIEDKECLLDYKAHWARLYADEEAEEKKLSTATTAMVPLTPAPKKKKWNFFAKKEAVVVVEKTPPPPPRFVLLRRATPKPFGESSDPVMRSIMAWQFARDWALGVHYCVKEDEALTMAAWGKRLMSLPQVIPNNQSKWRQPIDAPPPQFANVTNFNDKALFLQGEEKILRVAEKDIVSHYLSLVKDRALFGAQFFHVQNGDDPSDYSRALIVAISMKGVHLLNAETAEPEAHFPLTHLLGWTATPVLVTLGVRLERKTKSGVAKIAVRLVTNNMRMGKEICALLLDNCNLVMKMIQAGNT